jgi:hypothetical protein
MPDSVKSKLDKLELLKQISKHGNIIHTIINNLPD